MCTHTLPSHTPSPHTHPPLTHTPFPHTQHPPLTYTLTQVLLLQTHWRRWLAERYVAAFRREKQEREEWDRKEAVRRQMEREAHIRHEFERRMNPHTKEDFELLYHALESKWGGDAVGGSEAQYTIHIFCSVWWFISTHHTQPHTA